MQPMVYLGFAWQGITLATAFALYARTRWVAVLTAKDVRWGRFPLAVSYAGAAVALGVVVTHGLRGTVADLVRGVLALAAAVAPALRRASFWVPLSLTWVGAGSMFAWGLWGLVNSVGGTVLATAVDPLDYVRAAAGLVLVGATWCAVRPLCTAASAGHPRTRGDR